MCVLDGWGWWATPAATVPRINPLVSLKRQHSDAGDGKSYANCICIHISHNLTHTWTHTHMLYKIMQRATYTGFTRIINIDFKFEFRFKWAALIWNIVRRLKLEKKTTCISHKMLHWLCLTLCDSSPTAPTYTIKRSCHRTKAFPFTRGVSTLHPGGLQCFIIQSRGLLCHPAPPCCLSHFLPVTIH